MPGGRAAFARHRLHPNIALSVLDCDAGASEVNLENRVELVVQSILEKMRPRP